MRTSWRARVRAASCVLLQYCLTFWIQVRKWPHTLKCFLPSTEAHRLCHRFSAGAAGRNGYLEVMIKMAEKYKKKMWGWAAQLSHHLTRLLRRGDGGCSLMVLFSWQLALDRGGGSDGAGVRFGHRRLWLPCHGCHQHAQDEICFAQRLFQWDWHPWVPQVGPFWL